MRAVESFETLSPLLGAQLRPGVATNVALTREEYQREIQGGALFWEEAPGALLLLRRRPGFYLVGFFLQRGAALPPVELPLPAVLEVAFRPRDKGLRQTLPQWEAQGFSPVFSRRRLLRPGGAPPPEGAGKAWVAGEGDLPFLEGVLKACFDPFTGCLPSSQELREDVRAGRVLRSTGGLLHISPAAGGTQLRHLAVLPESRRQGEAQGLFALYMEREGGRPSRCWVREDNLPARRFYEKNGYTPEEWASVVYRKG